MPAIIWTLYGKLHFPRQMSGSITCICWGLSSVMWTLCKQNLWFLVLNFPVWCVTQNTFCLCSNVRYSCLCHTAVTYFFHCSCQTTFFTEFCQIPRQKLCHKINRASSQKESHRREEVLKSFIKIFSSSSKSSSYRKDPPVKDTLYFIRL